MGIMDQSVEDGISNGGVTDLFMPMCHGKLTSDDSRGMSMPFFNNFQKGSTFGVVHGSEPEVIDDQDMGLSELINSFTVASISLG